MYEEEYERYIIKKGKDTDIVSSMKKIDKELMDTLLSEQECKTIEEYANWCLDITKETFDSFPGEVTSVYYYTNLLKNEGTNILPAFADVEFFTVFLYRKNDMLTYYIPDEMKKIIKEYLNILS